MRMYAPPRRRCESDVEADFSVELSRDDAALEIPWAGEGALRYYDLKRHPECINALAESREYPELVPFLTFINSPASILESAKCDVWHSTDIGAEEDMFGASCKFGSYVDLLFSDNQLRYSLAEHERFAKRIVKLLKAVPDIPARAEFIIRRCYYHPEGERDSRVGFFISCYVIGFGQDADQARRQWGIALQIVENAARQLSSAVRP